MRFLNYEKHLYSECGCLILCSQLPQNIQTLLFSATYSDDVKHFAHKVVLNPIELFLKREEETLSNIRQTFVLTPTIDEKYKALSNIYATISIGQCMIFCRVCCLSCSCTTYSYLYNATSILLLICSSSLFAFAYIL